MAVTASVLSFPQNTNRAPNNIMDLTFHVYLPRLWVCPASEEPDGHKEGELHDGRDGRRPVLCGHDDRDEAEEVTHEHCRPEVEEDGRRNEATAFANEVDGKGREERERADGGRDVVDGVD
jgi:hypothetical protein